MIDTPWASEDDNLDEIGRGLRRYLDCLYNY